MCNLVEQALLSSISKAILSLFFQTNVKDQNFSEKSFGQYKIKPYLCTRLKAISILKHIETDKSHTTSSLGIPQDGICNLGVVGSNPTRGSKRNFLHGSSFFVFTDFYKQTDTFIIYRQISPLSPIFGQLFDKQYKIYIKIKEILSVCAEIYVILQDSIRNTARIIS